MTWDKSEPKGTREIRSSDELIRENWDCLEDALQRDHAFPATKGDTAGEHKYVTLQNQGGVPPMPDTGQARIGSNDGVVETISGDGTTYQLKPDIPSGTKMLFKQSSAPTGWTFQSEDNDRVLINTSTENDGGSTGGSWTIGLSVDNHTLTIAEMPAHGHTYRVSSDNDTDPDEEGGFTTDNEYTSTVGPYDGGTANTTSGQQIGARGGGDSHGHGLSGDDGNWRPRYAKCITCEKD